MSNYKDITYEVGANAVRVTINRPDVLNAFRLQTVEELWEPSPHYFNRNRLLNPTGRFGFTILTCPCWSTNTSEAK